MSAVTTANKEYEHLGETRGIEDHDHDLIHELSRRLDSLWRYDQYVANANGQAKLKKFWREVKVQETKTSSRSKSSLRST